eukprot:361167_1
MSKKRSSFPIRSDFAKPLIPSTLPNQTRTPILMDNIDASQSVQDNALDTDESYTSHTSFIPHSHSYHAPYVDDEFSINKPRKQEASKQRFNFSVSSTLASRLDVKDLLLRQLRNRNDTNSIRYIRRDKTASSNVVSQGWIAQRGYSMVYHKLIDRAWLILIFELLLIYTSIYVLFATLFYYMDYAYNSSPNPQIMDLYHSDYWSLCFDFSVHTGTSIGYGYLLPKDLRSMLPGFTLLIFIYATEIFETLFTGVFIQKISKPTRLKTQLRFSECAVINSGYSTTRVMHSSIDTSLKFSPKYPRHKYSDFDIDCGTIHDAGSYNRSEENDEYECLMFRFCHIRPQSRMCMPTMYLIYYEHDIFHNGRGIDWMKHKHRELDYEIYKKRGRMRSDSNDIPMLSLPWTVVHKIDENSPLFGLTKQDIARKKIEIIAIAGGIDEITSDNFQKWWSYTAEEIFWKHQFEPMVKCIVKPDAPWYNRLLCCVKRTHAKYKEILEIDFDRLSLISPITEYLYT